MHPDDDKFTDIITAVWAKPPAAGPGPAKRPHRVLWFEVGTILFLVIAILTYALVWLLRHGG